MSTAPLFLVDALPTGEEAVLDGPEGRHAATVKRLRRGEELVLADGRGGLAPAVVEAVTGRDTLAVRIVHRLRVDPPAPRVLLAQALVKGERGELAVELATEAGIDGVLPWRAARCVAKWEPGPRGDRALERWRGTVRAAAKQARRPWVPWVEEPLDTRALARRAAAADLALVLHEAAADGLADIAGQLPERGDVLLAVGPEGGVSDAELDELVAAGARAVRLGPEVLRASTAGTVALGAISALTSRWTHPI
ncbi:16S rRNA (uracil(1498)-N(3))-methyltransferase [Pseudonocardia asaccharolytica]|uniref:Ribosomal RNA small subunit methyltransferase E n=1 Tax=Pseudonocardia asaccharolytica DSM 44247 = NBRC 16224 TaxID=1123024 RepID=A0A511CWD6_9PSEU|nr:16S rRNA (uracil(1498)-N(3))-methyltransferase [Pseudonocardia asaccharolytica]GEL16872.1 ribosomal RNA small subunit methyltransferase E [Pseudonocardia asaccharolytica DSM 44247 = NBRC 16224]